MDNTEAIRIVEREKNRFLDNYVDFSGTEEAYNRAITALKQQEPAAPVCTEYDRSIVLFSCRDCKTQLLYGQRYCHMCGKAVKWN